MCRLLHAAFWQSRKFHFWRNVQMCGDLEPFCSEIIHPPPKKKHRLNMNFFAELQNWVRVHNFWNGREQCSDPKAFRPHRKRVRVAILFRISQNRGVFTVASALTHSRCGHFIEFYQRNATCRRNADALTCSVWPGHFLFCFVAKAFLFPALPRQGHEKKKKKKTLFSDLRKKNLFFLASFPVVLFFLVAKKKKKKKKKRNVSAVARDQRFSFQQTNEKKLESDKISWMGVQFDFFIPQFWDWVTLKPNFRDIIDYNHGEYVQRTGLGAAALDPFSASQCESHDCVTPWGQPENQFHQHEGKRVLTQRQHFSRF